MEGGEPPKSSAHVCLLLPSWLIRDILLLSGSLQGCCDQWGEQSTCQGSESWLSLLGSSCLLGCDFIFLFPGVIDSWMALTFACKHAACYYACINILINTRCSIGRVITCHLSSASSKKSLPCNCSVIYLGGMRYIPRSLSLHLIVCISPFKIHNIPSQGLPWSKINLAI